MKLSQWWKTGLAWGIVLSVGLPISTTEVAAQEETARIYCGQNYDEESDATSPATIVKINDQKTTLIIWTEEKFSNPQQRCEESSPRFQEAYDNGSLNSMTNGTINGQPVICTYRELNDKCDTLLMTLKPEDNSLQIVNNLKDQLNGYSVGPVKHSSSDPQVFVQFDLEELLHNKPLNAP